MTGLTRHFQKVISMKQLDNRKKLYNDNGYITNIIETFFNNMFTYNPPKGLDKMQVENALHSGIAALYICPIESSVNFGRWCCTPALPTTTIDNNKNFTKCNTFGTDYSIDLVVDKECILLYNNSTKSSDVIIERYSDLINEIDKTIYTIVKWSRLVPIPKVYTDSDIAKYKLVMEDVLKGNLINVISDKKMILDNDTSKESGLLQLTDANASEKLHFLSQFREEVIKRICSLYGLPMNFSAKNAQVISDELHNFDIFSTVLLIDRYIARKESFERASVFTGTDWKFDFSDICKHVLKDTYQHSRESEESENTESE